MQPRMFAEDGDSSEGELEDGEENINANFFPETFMASSIAGPDL